MSASASGDGAKILLWGAGIVATIVFIAYVVFNFESIAERLDEIAGDLKRPRPKPEDMAPIDVASETVAEPEPQTAIVPVEAIAKPMENQSAPEFTHSEDFRMVKAHGKTFSLTLYQSRAFEKLWKACQNRLPELHQAAILEGIDSCSKRLRDVFKSNMEAYRALITRGERKGTFRLNFGSKQKA